ncbi:MAG: hypothetical protein HDT27_04900 [Subdoligranulum sp.]|nr:hypothetical protein [Subdoligranulum sp.]
MSALLAVCLLLTGAGGCGAREAAEAEPLSYPDYSMVVTSWDTPREVLDELAQAGVTPVEYYGDTPLLLSAGAAALGETASIYLCEGTYEVGSGDFIQTDASVELTIVGAGMDKTLIVADPGLRDNLGAAVSVTGGTRRVTVRDLSAQGFRCGVEVKNAANVRMERLLLKDNVFAGVRLAGAAGCSIEGCTLEGNGRPAAQDDGWGLSLDAASSGNTGKDNLYRNNGNRNAVDFPAIWADYTSNRNEIGLELVYDIDPAVITLTDPIQAAKNARPGETALRYEFEDGGYTGASEVSEGNMAGASAGKYVFLFDGTLTMRVDVPQAGNYRLFIVGGSDDGNNKCDYVQVNGGPAYLTSYPGKDQGEWRLSQPGTEAWANSELTPQTPAEGFPFGEGENVITITANWGYCAYDCVYLEMIDAA